MPSVAPVAVEPRKINPPDTVTNAPAPEAEEKPIGAEGIAPQKRFPVIPILAGVIGVIVLALLIKVLKAK